MLEIFILLQRKGGVGRIITISLMFVVTLSSWVGLPLSRCFSSSFVSTVMMLKVITGIIRVYI